LSACAAARDASPPASPSTSASTSASPQTGRTPSQAPDRGAHCRGGGAAFAESLSTGLTGAATPVEAAQVFLARASVPGYAPPVSTWSVGARDADGGVTLRAGLFWLHARQLPDKTWVIDGGGRCT
jgi:hypothetical protein